MGLLCHARQLLSVLAIRWAALELVTALLLLLLLLQQVCWTCLAPLAYGPSGPAPHQSLAVAVARGCSCRATALAASILQQCYWRAAVSSSRQGLL
jgi:hypothetical protein